ncbi:CdaR family transcriptional regulator [Sporomusa acidovorans]|nr:sugar diacid recognition domain-containing protein [Sporomusa acidovorans]
MDNEKPNCKGYNLFITARMVKPMIISQEIAQTIVNHLMSIIKRNVNIMDCDGIIIASGEKARIHTFHQGGKFAVSQQTVIEISPNETMNFAGALPGVMWPIELKGKIVGVVGVTGEPQEVRSTARLVKTVTELILERDMLLSDYSSENRLKEQLISLLFSVDLETVQEDIQTLAEMLNFKLEIPRIVILVDIETPSPKGFVGLQNLMFDRVRESVIRAIKNSHIFSQDDLVLFYKRYFCILRTVSEKQNAKFFLKNLVDLFHSLPLQIRVGVGGDAQNQWQLRQSYLEAIFSIEYKCLHIIRNIKQHQIMLDFVMSPDNKNYSSCLALLELSNKVANLQPKYDIYNTLSCLLTNNLNISATSSELFIHRNTLKFRLEKLEQFTGLSPCHSFADSVLCKLILEIQAHS